MCDLYWVVLEMIPTTPTEKNLCNPEGGGDLFLIMVDVLGHGPEGVQGVHLLLIFCGGGMDVFWNDTVAQLFYVLICTS